MRPGSFFCCSADVRYYGQNLNPLSANPAKWLNTQTTPQIADGLFKCVWLFYWVGA